VTSFITFGERRESQWGKKKLGHKQFADFDRFINVNMKGWRGGEVETGH
jgi:hypothetical protein